VIEKKSTYHVPFPHPPLDQLLLSKKISSEAYDPHRRSKSNKSEANFTTDLIAFLKGVQNMAGYARYATLI